MNLYEYIMCNEPEAEQTFVRTAVREVNMPKHLHEDCAQEIRIKWLLVTADTTLQHSQIMAYAKKIASSVAASMWYRMAHVVTLPESHGYGEVTVEYKEPDGGAPTAVTADVLEIILSSDDNWESLSSQITAGEITFTGSPEVQNTQKSIVSLLSNGLQPAEAAAILGISKRTVFNHLKRLRGKTCV